MHAVKSSEKVVMNQFVVQGGEKCGVEGFCWGWFSRIWFMGLMMVDFVLASGLGP